MSSKKMICKSNGISKYMDSFTMFGLSLAVLGLAVQFDDKFSGNLLTWLYSILTIVFLVLSVLEFNTARKR